MFGIYQVFDLGLAWITFGVGYVSLGHVVPVFFSEAPHLLENSTYKPGAPLYMFVIDAKKGSLASVSHTTPIYMGHYCQRIRTEFIQKDGGPGKEREIGAGNKGWR